MAYDNPARRLHSLLTKAFDVADKQDNKQSVSCNVVWSQVFGVHVNQKTELLSYAEEFLFLLKCSREAIERLQSVRKEPYLRPLDHISNQIQSHGFFGGKWANLGNGLNNPAIMDMLEITANAIDVQGQLMTLEESQLAELLDATSSLLEEVRASNLDIDIKTFLSVRLEEICHAIDHYSVYGSEGLRRVVETNIGATVLKTYGLYSNGETPAPIQKFLNLMLKFGSWLGLAADVSEFLLPTAAELIKQLPPSA
ncbi:MAG: hypothetical protein F6J97_01035 [Leptolyngbya sp. SIO4C1]|nr:hypothetical protein [Leptolyngbya sp. SIO4C1]